MTGFLSVAAPRSHQDPDLHRSDSEVVAALVRGDHEVNEVKLRNLLGADTAGAGRRRGRSKR